MLEIIKIIGRKLKKNTKKLEKLVINKMSKSKINIVGIGCDFQTEGEESRKLAIENLSGGEKIE